ncbi:MAG: toll/interleukin-1 receptor domain-containing protein [Acidobacteriia bacterium]|nr:toll/interleukin-1 receptor domain-containing protein [Terriglobia bacterium]
MADPAKAFVSYSRADTDFVLRLCQDLRAAGASIWLDQLDIHPGEEWDQAIERGLSECGRMLVVLSPQSVSSQNVLDEIGYALSKKKSIIPVLYRDCEIPYRLNRLEYVDFRTAYDERLKDLLLAIGDAKENPKTIPVPVAHVRSRRLYLLAGAGAAAIAGLLTWATFVHRPVPVDLKPAVETHKPEPVTTDPPAQSTTSPAAGNSQPAPESSFPDSFRKTLLRYISEAPSGFQTLGAKEWVDWTPSVSLPGAASCRGSGYPREPVIECVLYRTDSEVKAANKFEDLIDLTRASLPEWQGSRMNMYVAYFSSKKVTSLVGLNVTNSGDHFDVVLSVRPKR